MSSLTADNYIWPELHRELRAVVVVDIVESVRLLQINEVGVIERWRRFVNEVRSDVLPRHEGRFVKSLGDGMLLDFAKASPAIAAALDIQGRIGAYNRAVPQDEVIGLRVGAQLADVYVDEGDIYGNGVNLASRLASLGGAGDIVVSSAIRDQLVPGLDADIEDLGNRQLEADIEDLGDCHLRHVAGTTRAFRLMPRKSRMPRTRPMKELPQPALAIMPFAWGTSHPAHEVIGEAIADGIASLVSANPRARVISRLSSSALACRNLQVEEVGQLLGAAYVLSGRISAHGARLSIFAELCDARSGEVIAAERRLTSVDDVFSFDSEAVAWAAALAVNGMESTELRYAMHRPLPTVDSYSLQLAAISLMHRSADQGFERSREMLEHLIERHGSLTSPRAWLAKWHVLRSTRGQAADQKTNGMLALEQTRRALDIDPNSALCHAVEGFVHLHLSKDFDAAARSFDRAILNNPSEPLTWLYRSVMHAFKGEGEAAIGDAEKALSLSPIDPMRYYFDSLAATAALSARRFERALELAEASCRLNRLHSSTWRVIAISQVALGRMDEARSAVTELLTLEPKLSVTRYLDRLPAAEFATGRDWAQALRQAGLPA